jgi:hypothetical protein
MSTITAQTLVDSYLLKQIEDLKDKMVDLNKSLEKALCDKQFPKKN